MNVENDISKWDCTPSQKIFSKNFYPVSQYVTVWLVRNNKMQKRAYLGKTRKSDEKRALFKL